MTTFIEPALQNSTIVRPSKPMWTRPTRRRNRHRGLVQRVLLPSDVPLVEAMSTALSARSLQRRFFAGTPSIPRALLRQLSTLDHDQHEAVIALAWGQVVGLAQYARLAGTDRAELAVMVADAWQHNGIGSSLVSHLADLATACGISAFDATVLHDNETARRAIARLWPLASSVDTEDYLEFRLPVADTRPTLADRR